MGCNPFTDIWDERAIEFIGLYLKRAVANPYDLEARWHVMAAATFAGLGFGNTGVHIPHAMAYPLASLRHEYQPSGYSVKRPLTPHGQAVALTCPAALRFTSPVWPERHALAADLLGADTDGLSVREAASLLPETIIQLMKDIGFPSGISAFGYRESDVPQIVEETVKQQRLLAGCPRQVGPKDLTRIAMESMNNW
jgi:alcohol dehydrogenase class IV